MDCQAVKICSMCKEEKSVDEFYPAKRTKSGLTSRCKKCELEVQRLRYENNSELRKQRIAYSKDYRKRNPNCRRVETYKRLSEQTGLPREMVKQLFEKRYTEQQGRCAICGKSEDELQDSGKLNFDHCHKSNKLRGLLCNNCNLAIGNFQDDAEICLLAYNYLRQF